MEFQLKTPIENSLQTIDFNFEQLRSYLDERLEVYRGLIVSPAGVRAAKADRAKLNKFKDALRAQRLEVKRAYMKPFDDFDAKMDELVSMVEKPISAIAEQLKRYENEAKEQKREEILSFFNTHIGELDGILTFERLFNDRWLNVTYRMSEIESEILGVIKKLRNDIRIIQAMRLPFEQEVLSVLIETHDIGAALSRKNSLEAQAAAIVAITPPEQEKPAQCESGATCAPKVTDVSNPDTVEAIDFRVWLTAAQKAELRAWFLSRNIRYGKVPEHHEEAQCQTA